ncbi:MAG: RNA polymerase sigma factor [Phycisphaerae bacterium]|nr:RNA polymerase sigma factor [Phycisphaerae bacterium]
MMDEDIRRHMESGDYRRALDLLVDRYQDKILHLALAMMRSREAAEDMTQETFVRIWKGLPGYTGAASLSTWIYVVARNTCLTELKRRASESRVSTEGSALERAAAAQVPGPDRGNVDVRALLDGLPERYRRVVTLYYLEERSYQEVAEMLGIPMGTVKTFLHRARRELTERMDGREDAYGLS